VDWVENTRDPKPLGRTDHAMVYDSVRKEMVMFGGYTSIPTWRELNDTWVYKKGLVYSGKITGLKIDSQGSRIGCRLVGRPLLPRIPRFVSAPGAPTPRPVWPARPGVTIIQPSVPRLPRPIPAGWRSRPNFMP